MKQKHYIDSHKASVGILILIVMALLDGWQNQTVWIYLAMHGTYGILWLLKSTFFGDKSWEQPCSPAYGALIWFALSLYMVNPVLIISREVEPPNWYIALCLSIYILGVFLHYTSDMQKYLSLKLRPGHLITEGIWSISRNPNYLGELMIYGGFSMLAMHPLPLLILLFFVGVAWLPNMWKKDRSLSRYPEFAAYSARTKLFIPYVY